MPTKTEILKLESINTVDDKNMTGKTFIEITSGIGDFNLKKIDDFAKKTNTAIQELKDSPATIYIRGMKELEGIYNADVTAIKKMVRNGVYIVSLNEANTTESTVLRINGIISVELKKVDIGTKSPVSLEIGDMPQNLENLYRYDGTDLVMISNNALTLEGKDITEIVLKSEVVDNVVSDGADVPLSANQGKLMNEKIDTEVSTIHDSLDLKAPIDNPTFTGTVKGITSEMVGLGNVNDTADIDKPISSVAQIALDLKASIDNPTFTGVVGGITKDMVGLENVDNTSDKDKPISDKAQEALDLKAPLESPTFTGTVSGIDNVMIGIPNVTNDAQVKRSEMGVANGVAVLDEAGLVPTEHLPSYVDDVLEFQLKSGLPLTGEVGKIYLVVGDTDENNGQYRWTGSQYMELPKSFRIGEVVGTVYAGEKGKRNADDIVILKSGKADKVKSATVGNFAGLDLNGNLTDSGKKSADFADTSHTHPANWDTLVGTLAHSKIGTVHTLTGNVGGMSKFKATADFAVGDTFTVNGVATPVLAMDNTQLSGGYFAVGNWLLLISDGEALRLGMMKSESALNTHIDDEVRHIKLAERIAWNSMTATVAYTYTATLTVSGWVTGTAPYVWKQTVNIVGMLATDIPIVGILLQGITVSDIEAEQESSSMITRITTAAGSITAMCLTDKPTVVVKLQMKVVR